MHPAAIAGIIVGGIVCIWGGYEIGTHLLDWISCRREQRKYEQYVQDYHEKQVLLQHESEDDDEDDDDNTPLARSSYLSSSSSILRQRNTPQPNDDEHTDMLLEQRGNSLMGFVAHDNDEKQHLAQEQQQQHQQQHNNNTLVMPSPMNASPTNSLDSRDQTSSEISSASKSSWAHAHFTASDDDDDEQVPSSLDGSSFGVLSLSDSSHNSGDTFDPQHAMESHLM